MSNHFRITPELERSLNLVPNCVTSIHDFEVLSVVARDNDILHAHQIHGLRNEPGDWVVIGTDIFIRYVYAVRHTYDEALALLTTLEMLRNL